MCAIFDVSACGHSYVDTYLTYCYFMDCCVNKSVYEKILYFSVGNPVDMASYT